MPDFESLSQEESEKSGGKKVLVVDDDERLLKSLKRSSRDNPHVEFAHVTSAEAARKKIEKAEPDVVYLDHEFEEGTGLDVVRHFENLQQRPEFVSTTSKGEMGEYKKRGIDHVSKRNLGSILRDIGKEDFSD